MKHHTHRVKRGPKHLPPPLPKDQWKGWTFVEADTGQEFEVVFSGRHMPSVDMPRSTLGRWQTIGHPVVGAP
jgi:hypothetical protein